MANTVSVIDEVHVQHNYTIFGL